MPVDIIPVGDPWSNIGIFTPFDTDLSGGERFNGSVDDDENYLPAPVTYSGPLSSFPVEASHDAEGVWDVVLDTALGASDWEGVPTRLIAGTITVSFE